VDAASPQLLHACSTGEPFESVVLSFPRNGAGGKSGKPNTIELVDGHIHKITLSSAIKGKRGESIILVYNGLKINGATASHSGGAETRCWRDTW
jgi:type VI protein secretion system component Hcp